MALPERVEGLRALQASFPLMAAKEVVQTLLSRMVVLLAVVAAHIQEARAALTGQVHQPVLDKERLLGSSARQQASFIPVAAEEDVTLLMFPLMT